MKPNLTFLDFCNQVEGYVFFKKKTGTQVYKWELYHSRITPGATFKNYRSELIPKPDSTIK